MNKAADNEETKNGLLNDRNRLSMLYGDGEEILLTDAQKRAVLAHGEVIVSAAAGSGKTSTMIKRIMLLIAEGASLRDMLVLVYNNAAADELKDRLHQELFERACKERGDTRERFRKELDDLPFCHICTIHAFCQSLIRENFEKIELSPTFEVLDEQAHAVYMNKALDNVFRQYSEQGDRVFDDIAQIFLQARKEENLKNNVIKLYTLMDIQPDRAEFIKNVEACFDSFENSKFADYLTKSYKAYFTDAVDKLKSLFAQLLNTSLIKYAQSVENVIDCCEKILRCDSVFAMGVVASTYEKISARRSPKATEEEKSLADNVKSYVSDVEKQFAELCELYETTDKLRFAHKQNAIYVKKLIEIVLRFDEELSKSKQDNNVLSFEDLQHKAVELLQKFPNTAESFDVVFVDEYQDVNPTQEFIISSLIRGECFMVGDIKQSIYGFRLADPTIFLSRQKRYLSDDDKEAIDFNRNFRSAKRILAFVNGVFDCVMTQRSADVDYKHTARFELENAKDIGYVQLHLFVGQKGREEQPFGLYDITCDDSQDESISASENEGEFIAREIRSLVGRAKGDGEYISFGDIAILFRNRSTGAQKIIEILKRSGIPLDENGFSRSVSAPERELINFLRVIDNPRQDIPLAGFMLSFFGGYSENDLAKIATLDGDGFYDKMLEASCMQNELASRICKTLKDIDKYRIKASFKNVAELMSGIVSDYSYDAYLMRAGEAEVYSLKAFIASSAAKDTSSLGRFLDEYSEQDARNINGAGGDRVHVSTFHGYKGLEIPIVFVADTARAFNTESARGDLLATGNGYVGMSFFDFENRVKSTTLSKIAVAKMIKENALKEEMRLLYVALTRAKQIMYVTASLSDNKCAVFGKLPKLSGINSDLDFISNALFEGSVDIPVFSHQPDEFVNMSASGQDALISKGDEKICDMIKTAQAYEYPYPQATRLGMKYSVSSLDSMDDQTLRIYEDSAKEGTAYHKVMQNIDYFASDIAAVVYELDKMVKEELLSEQERSLIDPQSILDCLHSEIMETARSVEIAAKDGACFRCMREQSFMMYKPANEVIEGVDAKDKVLVQGVVDLFINGKQKIIVDFKNSYLNRDESLQKYKKQLYLYKKAIESAVNDKIDRVVLYSFKTGKTIDL